MSFWGFQYDPTSNESYIGYSEQYNVIQSVVSQANTWLSQTSPDDYIWWGYMENAAIYMSEAANMAAQLALDIKNIIDAAVDYICGGNMDINDFCSLLCQAVTQCPQCFIVTNWPQSRDYIEAHLTDTADNESTVNALLDAFNNG